MLMLIALLAAVPSPAMQTAIKEKVGKELSDPFSAQYDWQPVKNEMLYCGWVNAKNGFGAYAGYEPFMVLYSIGNKSGKVSVYSADLKPNIVTPMCIEKGYRLTR